MKLERSLRKIQEVVRRKNIFWYISDKEDPEDWHPHPQTVAFSVGSGLIFYEPRTKECAEMYAALDDGDMPSNPSEQVREQWDYLKSLGFHTVYAQVADDHDRSKLMCRAIGMEKHSSGDLHIYKKVI
jgi:hypothetical protein